MRIPLDLPNIKNADVSVMKVDVRYSITVCKVANNRELEAMQNHIANIKKFQDNFDNLINPFATFNAKTPDSDIYDSVEEL